MNEDEQWEDAETTGAVERAAEAILEACYGQELPVAPIDLARAALVAALSDRDVATGFLSVALTDRGLSEDGHPERFRPVVDELFDWLLGGAA